MKREVEERALVGDYGASARGVRASKRNHAHLFLYREGAPSTEDGSRGSCSLFLHQRSFDGILEAMDDAGWSGKRGGRRRGRPIESRPVRVAERVARQKKTWAGCW